MDTYFNDAFERGSSSPDSLGDETDVFGRSLSSLPRDNADSDLTTVDDAPEPPEKRSRGGPQKRSKQ